MVKSLIGNVAVSIFLLLFVFVNVKEFFATGDIGYALVALNESVYVVFYLVREKAAATSASAADWAVAFSATFIGTLLRPANPFNILLGDTLIAAGTVANIASVFYLNRSIGIVPAQRTIKTGGLYRYVRHPMYSSEILALFGYLLVNVSLANALITIGNTALLMVRSNREEQFLSSNERYRTYVHDTRWKLIPFLY